MPGVFSNLITALQAMNAHGLSPVANKYPAIFSDPRRAQELLRLRDLYYTDTESKKLFDWLYQRRVIFECLGAFAPQIELPDTPYPPEAWRKLEKQASAMCSGFATGDYLLDRIDVWLLESYTLPGVCEVTAGDVVLDCGSFTGNTSLYFSQKAGESGHVHCFEPLPDSFSLLRKNLQNHTNVTLNKCAIGKDTGLISFSSDAFASRANESGELRVPQVSIDGYAQSAKLDRVDFIKMDIEGAELDALHGASRTIRRYKPKMALSAYHITSDIYILPEAIQAIVPEYRFALRHFSDCDFETVLFCYIEK